MKQHKQTQLNLISLMKRIGLKYLKQDWPDGLEYVLWNWLHSEDPPITDHEKYQLWQSFVSARSWPIEGNGIYRFLEQEDWLIEYEKFND